MGVGKARPARHWLCKPEDKELDPQNLQSELLGCGDGSQLDMQDGLVNSAFREESLSQDI